MKQLASCFLAFLVLLLFVCEGHGAELTKLRVGTLITEEFSQTYIPQKKGFFEKYGLDSLNR